VAGNAEGVQLRIPERKKTPGSRRGLSFLRSAAVTVLLGTLGGRWKQTIQAEIVRELTVVIGEIRSSDDQHRTAGDRASAEERQHLTELRVIHVVERRCAVRERLFQPRDEGVLAVR